MLLQISLLIFPEGFRAADGFTDLLLTERATCSPLRERRDRISRSLPAIVDSRKLRWGTSSIMNLDFRERTSRVGRSIPAEPCAAVCGSAGMLRPTCPLPSDGKFIAINS